MATTERFDLEAVIHGAVRARMAQIVSEEADAAAARVRERLSQELDVMALSVLSQYNIEQAARHLVITVNKAK